MSDYTSEFPFNESGKESERSGVFSQSHVYNSLITSMNPNPMVCLVALSASIGSLFDHVQYRSTKINCQHCYRVVNADRAANSHERAQDKIISKGPSRNT